MYTPLPLPPHIPHRKADRPEQPVNRHCHPDSENSPIKRHTQQPTESDSEDPHRNDGKYHGKFHIGGCTQGVGQCERKRPYGYDADCVISDDASRVSCSLRGQVIHFYKEWKCCQYQQVHEDIRCVRKFQELLGVITGLSAVSAPTHWAVTVSTANPIAEPESI